MRWSKYLVGLIVVTTAVLRQSAAFGYDGQQTSYESVAEMEARLAELESQLTTVQQAAYCDCEGPAVQSNISTDPGYGGCSSCEGGYCGDGGCCQGGCCEGGCCEGGCCNGGCSDGGCYGGGCGDGGGGYGGGCADGYCADPSCNGGYGDCYSGSGYYDGCGSCGLVDGVATYRGPSRCCGGRCGCGGRRGCRCRDYCGYGGGDCGGCGEGCEPGCGCGYGCEPGCGCGGDCSGGCCDQCGYNCLGGGQCSGGWIVSGEAMALRPQQSESAGSQEKFELATRSTIGYTTAGGQTVRARYFEFGADNIDFFDDNTDRLRMDMLDVEYAANFGLGRNWVGEFSGGVRWARYDEEDEIRYHDTLGPEVGLQLWSRPIFCTSFFMSARQSFQYGRPLSYDGPDFDREELASFGISELQIGCQWQRCACGSTLYVRTTAEAQRWTGISRYDSEDMGLVGFGLTVGLSR